MPRRAWPKPMRYTTLSRRTRAAAAGWRRCCPAAVSFGIAAELFLQHAVVLDLLLLAQLQNRSRSALALPDCTAMLTGSRTWPCRRSSGARSSGTGRCLHGARACIWAEITCHFGYVIFRKQCRSRLQFRCRLGGGGRMKIRSRRRFCGRQPLCGTGVTSEMELMRIPSATQRAHRRLATRARTLDLDVQVLMPCFDGGTTSHFRGDLRSKQVDLRANP